MKNEVHEATCTCDWPDEDGVSHICGQPCACHCEDGKHDNCWCEDCNEDFYGQE